ncbi:MAG: hypothetical protein IJ689_00955 [Alphaproteobacteria bacterium]|nr:hypothetical protein [Alphaproteobacteria bacterium]
MSMIALIFTFFIGCLMLGLLKGILMGIDGLFDFYGGIMGTIIALIINTGQWCVICFAAGLIIPYIDFKLGLILGPIYCLYCWIFNHENKFLTWWFNAD